MGTHYAKAKWNGTLKEGNGVMNFTGYEGPYNYKSRFEDGAETSPEELVGAANAGCFSMFLSALIAKEGLTAASIETSAAVELGQDDGPKITSIKLTCEAVVPDLSEEKFNELAATAKEKCPISRLFTGTDITLDAKLK
ncbi:MAG: OsmC family peroxiredoxin [Melioribacteraceae bacterium]|nr:OsmC family peroxiredoxin [Melioribacteraceae bacterium]MCF8356425.1 OsmC family peroxiredoxin [Melioribacteraceae bacterium]MCF8395780.1 OsmC family peroxiredoxin [Melioribacteraceae bacterium]MCF8420909.1 OsmC family peroxiredoxin [Melioribacteraceae bacterium]